MKNQAYKFQSKS